MSLLMLGLSTFKDQNRVRFPLPLLMMTLDCGVDATDRAPSTPTFFAPIRGSVATQIGNRKKLEKTSSEIHTTTWTNQLKKIGEIAFNDSNHVWPSAQRPSLLRFALLLFVPTIV